MIRFDSRVGMIPVFIGVLLAVIGCSDSTTPSTADTPINGMWLSQYATDSLRVTFDVTVAYQRASLLVNPYDANYPIELVEEISNTEPREFKIRWADWFDDVAGAYISVRIHYEANGATQYTWSKRFVPKS